MPTRSQSSVFNGSRRSAQNRHSSTSPGAVLGSACVLILSRTTEERNRLDVNMIILNKRSDVGDI